MRVPERNILVDRYLSPAVLASFDGEETPVPAGSGF